MLKLDQQKMIKIELGLLFVLEKSVSSKTYPALPTLFKPFKVSSRILMIKSDQLRQLLSVESLLETLLSSWIKFSNLFQLLLVKRNTCS